MRKIVLAIITYCIFACSDAVGQSDPLLTNYMFNKLLYNPATAGMGGNYINISGDLHGQWSRIQSPEGETPPNSEFASVDVPLRLFKNHPEYYIGIGVQAAFDKEAFYNSNNYLISGAFHTVPKFGGDLSFGFNAGYINNTIGPMWKGEDIDGLVAPRVSSASFDAGLGIYYSTNKWYGGISVFHLTGEKINLGFENYSIYPAWYLTGGYNIDIKNNPDLELEPSLLIKQEGNLTSFGLTTLFFYKQRFWGGINFRSDNVTALAAMAGVVFLKGKIGDARLGLSYDVATQVPTPFGGAFELMLNGRIKI